MSGTHHSGTFSTLRDTAGLKWAAGKRFSGTRIDDERRGEVTRPQRTDSDGSIQRYMTQSKFSALKQYLCGNQRMDRLWSSPSPRGQWRTGENGGNWLRNHLWSRNDPRGKRIDEVKWEIFDVLSKSSVTLNTDVKFASDLGMILKPRDKYGRV